MRPSATPKAPCFPSRRQGFRSAFPAKLNSHIQQVQFGIFPNGIIRYRMHEIFPFGNMRRVSHRHRKKNVVRRVLTVIEVEHQRHIVVLDEVKDVYKIRTAFPASAPAGKASANAMLPRSATSISEKRWWRPFSSYHSITFSASSRNLKSSDLGKRKSLRRILLIIYLSCTCLLLIMTARKITSRA